MKKTLLSLFLFPLCFSLTAQQFDRFAMGTAFDYSVINNRMEVRGQYKPGINFRLMGFAKPWFAVSGEFTQHFVHPSSPGLMDIHSWNSDVNCHFITSLGETDMKFTALFGAGYLNWAGTYIGPLLHDNSKYTYGMRIKQDFVTVNLGFGFSHDIWKHAVGFGEFKVRMASEGKRNDDLFSVVDAAINLGARISFGTVGETNTDPKGQKNNHRFRRPGRLYRWLHD